MKQKRFLILKIWLIWFMFPCLLPPLEMRNFCWLYFASCWFVSLFQVWRLGHTPAAVAAAVVVCYVRSVGYLAFWIRQLLCLEQTAFNLQKLCCSMGWRTRSRLFPQGFFLVFVSGSAIIDILWSVALVQATSIFGQYYGQYYDVILIKSRIFMQISVGKERRNYENNRTV